jgi:hypothetical protein
MSMKTNMDIDVDSETDMATYTATDTDMDLYIKLPDVGKTFNLISDTRSNSALISLRSEVSVQYFSLLDI